MTFGAPPYLGLFALVGVCLIAVGLWMRWRRRATRRFSSSSTTPSAARRMLLVSPMLIIAAVALTAIAAARPQFGERPQTTEERGIDVAIVLDISRSMDATDVEPSRLAAAQAQLFSLLDAVEGDRVGLVVFAGETLVRSPLTSDATALRRVIENVDGEQGLLRPGSDLAEGIEAGRRLLENGEARTKAMVIVSDGEDHGSTLDSVITRSVRSGIQLYVVGVGTLEGAPVPDADTGVPQVDETGVPVVSRLAEQTLQSIAERGGGRYVRAGGDAGSIDDIAGDLAELQATTFARDESSLPIERFQIFAALALLLVDLELLWSAVRGEPTARRVSRLWPLAVPMVFIAGICSTSGAEINERGNDAYERGEHARALDLYRTAGAGGEAPGEIAYNASNTLQQLGQDEEAIEEARRAVLELGDSSVAEYALGSHFAADGQFAGAMEAFKRALLIDPDDVDAKHNLEVVTILLTPTVAPTQAPTDGTPDPGSGDDSAPGGEPAPDPNAATMAPNQSTNGATRTAGTTPTDAAPPEQQLSDEELRLAIDEALSGIEEEFTTEEALELLRLLEEENRRSVGNQEGDFARPGQPDY